jgi:hypothetical protein
MILKNVLTQLPVQVNITFLLRIVVVCFNVQMAITLIKSPRYALNAMLDARYVLMALSNHAVDVESII